MCMLIEAGFSGLKIQKSCYSENQFCNVAAHRHGQESFMPLTTVYTVSAPGHAG